MAKMTVHNLPRCRFESFYEDVEFHLKTLYNKSKMNQAVGMAKLVRKQLECRF